MMNRTLLALTLVACTAGPLSSIAHAGEAPVFDSAGDEGRDVPEMDAGFAALGLGLTVGLVAFVRDRNRRNK